MFTHSIKDFLGEKEFSADRILYTQKKNSMKKTNQLETFP